MADVDDIKEFELKRWLLACDKWATAAHAERLKSLEQMQTYGLNSLRLLFVLNAGSIAALLTFIGSFFTKGDSGGFVLIGISLGTAVLPAFYWFSGGIIATAVSSGIAYLNWGGVSATDASPNDILNFIHGRTTEKAPYLRRYVQTTLGLTIVSAVIALAAWIYGMLVVAKSFAIIGIS